MKINISFILAISMPLISSGVVFNHALHTIKNTKQQSPIIYHTHAEQMVHTDGNDVNTDFDVVKWHQVNFDQKFKKIYLSHKNEFVTANKMLLNTKQTNICTDNDGSGTCGGKSYNWNTDCRIHDWTNEFRDSLYMKLDNKAPSFGHSKQKLYLKQKRLLANKQSYKSLTCPTMFGRLFEHASDIKFGVGFNRNFTSKNWMVYGINKAWLKETAHVKVLYNWVDRFLWTLNAGDAPHQQNISTPSNEYGEIKIDEGGINTSSYNIEHLIKISNPNYESKSVKLIIDDEFIQFAKEWHTSLKDIPFDQLTQQQKDLVKKFEITNNDDPWDVLNELQNVLKFEIEYRITDPLKVNEFKNEKITVSYDSLLNGFDLHLNKNQNNKYLFQLINVSCLEISTPELFIQRSSTKNITNGSLQIGLTDNNFYELLPPKIANIEFKNSDSSNLNNIYPSSLDDMEIFKMFVTLIDTYGMRDDYSLLTNDMYQIQRDDVNGTIEININVDNIRINKIYDGFKRTTNQSYELDASKAAFNIIPDELDNEEINEIFIANGFSQPIVQSSTFKVMDIDDIKGIANIKITSGPLMDKCYKIANLQPYYIKVKDKIDKKYLTINPSKIDTQSLKSNYLDISNEFLSRNQDSLSFILDSNNEKKILVVHVSYYEDFDSKFIKTDLTINFASRKNINWIIIIIGVFSAITLITLSWLFFKRMKKRKNIPLN